MQGKVAAGFFSLEEEEEIGSEFGWRIVSLRGNGFRKNGDYSRGLVFIKVAATKGGG